MTQVNGTNELILRSTTPDSGWMRQDRRRQADALVALRGSAWPWLEPVGWNRVEPGPIGSRNGSQGLFDKFELVL